MTNNTLPRLFFVVLVSSCALFLSSCASAPTADTDAGQKELADKWGIQVESVRLTAGNYMVDLRYRVLDAEKAARVITPRINPYLIDQASGAKFVVPSPPRIGPLRQTRSPQIAGKSYFIFFANPGQYIKPGNKVTMILNDVRIENLAVQ
mgnify:FL=1